MAVWGLACKKESSLNRWFDGTDQDVYFNDKLYTLYSTNKSETINQPDSNRKVLLKNISQVKSGLSTQTLNSIKINGYSIRISSFDNAIFANDDIEILFSRAILHFADTLYAVESFNKEITSSFEELSSLNDTTNISVNEFSNFNIDTASMVEHVGIGLVKRINSPVDDSLSFTENFKAHVGGKSFNDYISIKDEHTKELTNIIGDESTSNPLGSNVLNIYTLNSRSDTPTITTIIGLVEEVQIILT